ncbi:MAG: glycosyltransferase family 39 protein [Chthoniobacteraceae bacterium]|nr:glycosyltransferase family 39 protein [Chthoniobacteraceae bacterium]
MPTLANPCRRSALRDILLLLLLCYAAFGWNLGKLGLIDPDEPFYALTGREMVQTGDWMTPRIFGQPQFEKPIFYYWMLAGSYRVFGESELSGRLPAAVAATLLVLLTYAFAKRVFNARAGLLAGVFLTGGLELCLMGRLMLTDIPLALFITAALYCYWRALEEPERSGRWIFWHLVCTGFAVLTKGPIGSLVPLFTMLAFNHFGKRPSILRGRAFWWGAAAHAAIVVPWYGLMLAEHGWKFMDEFFYRDNVLRFFKAEHPANNHWWYYPGLLLLGSIPWLPAVLLALRRMVFGMRDNTGILFAACWLLPNLLFLTLAQSKLPSYGYYLFVPLAFLAGAALDSLLSHGFQTRGEKALVLCGAVVQAAAALIAPLLPVAKPFAATVWAFGAVLAVAAVALALRRFRFWMGATAMATVVLIGCALTVSFSPVEEMVSIRSTALKMKAQRQADEPLLAGKFAMRGVVYYTNLPVSVLSGSGLHPFWADHPVTIINGKKGLAQLLETTPSALCTMRKADWNTFRKSSAFETPGPDQWSGESLFIRARRPAAEGAKVSPAP